MKITVFGSQVDKQKDLSLSCFLGLKQAYELDASKGEHKWPFTTEFYPKNSSKRFFTQSKVYFEPTDRVRWLLNEHLAGKFGFTDFTEITDYIRECFVAMSRTSNVWERVYVFFMGTGTREARNMGEVSKKDPDQVAEYVINQASEFDSAKMGLFKGISSSQRQIIEEIAREWVTAYICNFLASPTLNWIVPGVQVERQMMSTVDIPSRQALENIVDAYELSIFLTRYGAISHDTVHQFWKDSTDSRRRVSALTLANATAREMGLQQQAIMAEVDSQAVIDTLFYVWRWAMYPDLVVDRNVPSTVLQSDTLSSLSRNITMWYIHAEQVKLGTDGYKLSYNVDIINEAVLKYFDKAFAEVAPFGVGPIDDRVASTIRRSLVNHEARPTMIQIYEDPRNDSACSAFTVSRLNDYKFLNPVIGLGEEFAAVNDSLAKQMTIGSLMTLTRALHQQTPMAIRMDARGPELTLNLPSLLMSAVQYNLSPIHAIAYAEPDATPMQQAKALYAIVRDYVDAKRYSRSDESEIQHLSNMMDTNAKKYVKGTLDQAFLEAPVVKQVLARLDQVKRSVFYKILVMAIRRSDEIAIVHHEGYSREAAEGTHLGLQFTVHTNHVLPLSHSAVDKGIVKTTEPLEALLYSTDWDEEKPLVHFAPSLPTDVAAKEHDNQWDWYQYTRALGFSSTFNTSLRGSSYSVALDERDLLRRRSRTRYIRRTENPMLVATVTSWLNQIRSELNRLEAEVTALAAKPNTADLVIAKQGIILGILERVVAVIIQLAKTGMAKNYAKQVRVAITEQMRNRNLIDDSADLSYIAFDIELEVSAAAAVIHYVASSAAWDEVMKLSAMFSKYRTWSTLVARRLNDEEQAS